MHPADQTVAIRPWAQGDLWLLQRLLGEEAMMLHLGGAQPLDAIRARHERYLTADPADNGLFAIVVGDRREPAGWVGYWAEERGSARDWECGWHVLPEFQGRGVASAAVSLLLEDARARNRYRFMRAYPAVENTASNSLCKSAGFELVGETEVEFPAGHPMRVNEWRYDLLGG